jgi:hypothetical protein
VPPRWQRSWCRRRSRQRLQWRPPHELIEWVPCAVSVALGRTWVAPRHVVAGSAGGQGARAALAAAARVARSGMQAIQVAWFRAAPAAASAVAQMEAAARAALAAVPMAAGICSRPTRAAPMAERIHSRPTLAAQHDWAARAAIVIWARAPQALPVFPSPCSAPPYCGGDGAGAARASASNLAPGSAWPGRRARADRNPAWRAGRCPAR